MLRLHSRGAPYERGLAHGKAFAAIIEEHIDTTCKIEPGYDDKIGELLARLKKNITALAPAQLEELHGIADGAGLEPDAVLKLCYWPEVTSGTVGLRFCSLIGVSDAEGGPILAKNSDHPLCTVRFLLLQRVDNSGGHSYIRGTFAGTLGTRAGINDAGLAMTTATIVPDATNWDGVPLMVVAQAILEQCATVDEAIALAKELRTVNYGAHLMVADARGNVADIECMPDQTGVRWPEKDLLFNTNHPLAMNTCDHSAAARDLDDNSHARYNRLQTLLAETPHTVAGLQSILRSHVQPGRICQHGGLADLHTTSSYILLPKQRKMLMAPGCPCQYDYIPVTVEAT